MTDIHTQAGISITSPGLQAFRNARERHRKDQQTALISLVMPVFNEQTGLPQVYSIVTELMESTGYPFEIVVSDNGSSDETEAIMWNILSQDDRWRYVRLSRNFGYQSNISVGMAMARGDAIIVIDSDLQDPPEMIHEFIKHWQQGYDIVYGVRMQRTEEPPLRIFLTMTAMRLISWMSDYPLPPHSSDFRLITRQVRDHFVNMNEGSRYVRGMIHWTGFRQIGLPYTRRGRQYDQDDRKWGAGILSLTNFALNAIFSFSLKPLRIFSIIGVVTLFISVIMFIGYLILFFVDRDLPPGFTTQLLVSLVQLGVLSSGIGVLGEYVGRIYMETKQRPLWLVDYMVNMEQYPQYNVDINEYVPDANAEDTPQ
ncbi:MAG: glycosyltransferase family 2 protein [Chloroflexota bacterium]